MLKTLIKKQCKELFQTYYIDKRTGKARDTRGVITHFIFLGCVFLFLGFCFYTISTGLAVSVIGKGYNWVYFAMMGLLAIALGIFGSVFSTYASLYLPKDNDFLLSLPIPVRYLMLSRMFGVYMMGLLYCAVVWIPACIAYWTIVPLNICRIVFPVIMLFLIALFILVLSCILGFLVALISKKIKGKSYIRVIFTLAFVALYYFAYSKISGSIGGFVKQLDTISETMQTKLYYFYLLGNGSDGNFVSLFLFLGITVLLAAVCVFVLTKTFTSINSAKAGSAKEKRTENRYVLKNQQSALLKREFTHFTSLPTWMLNGGFGLIVLAAASVAAIFSGGIILDTISEVSTQIPQIQSLLPVFVLIVVFFVISSDPILPVSVSMEGKNLWLLQSMPVKAWDILKAKERMAILLSIFPVLLFDIACSAVFRIPVFEAVLIIISSVLYLCLVSDFGLFLNLKKPNFNWTNEAYLTKQSMPVSISLFTGWGFVILLGAGGFLLSSILQPVFTLIIYILVITVLLLILRRWLKHKGTEIFTRL